MSLSSFATTSSFFRKKARRVSVILFVGVIIVSEAYQPSFRSCKWVNASKYQRSISLKAQVGSNDKELGIKPYFDKDGNEARVKGSSIETVSSSQIFDRVQKGLARLTEIIPKPIRVAVVAVASGLLLFELSKTLLFLAVPIIAVLGERRIS